MKIQYNTEVFEFENYDELDEYIVVDDEWKKLYGNSEYFNNYKVVKVWKNGRITDKNNKDLKIGTRIKEYSIIKNGKEIECKENISYWKYGRGKYDNVEIKEIIWKIYSRQYNFNKSLLIGDEFRGLYFKDGDFNNNRLDNLIKYIRTNEETEVYHNNNNYFDFNLEIERDIDDFIILDEPVVLDELPDLEVYSNGKVIDRRGKSNVLSNKNGYDTISYKSKNYFIHRLVAKCYLRNKNGCNLVNHIDGDRKSNDVKNLEWVNNTINTLHGGISIKLNNEIDFKKYNNRSSGVKGWISLTSKGYRNFIKKKIIEECEMDVDCWIFSHKTPLFLLYIPFSRNFGLKPDLNSWSYRMFNRHLNHEINNDILFNKFFGKENLRYNELFKGNLKYSKNTYSIIVESINNYLISKNSKHHLINILKILGVDFNIYFDWLFDELKTLVGDDVGFIFYEEMKDYIYLLRMGNKLYVNEYLSRLSKKHDIIEIKDKGYKIIYFSNLFHRVIEEIPRSFGDKFVGDTTKTEIKRYYEHFFFWDMIDDE